MASVNKVIVIGNLGADAELRYTNNGVAVANFRLATNERWSDKNGETQERTEWHRVIAWGKLAEICGQYLKKGGSVYVEGRLQTRQWEDRDGVKRYTTEIVAQVMQMLGKPDTSISSVLEEAGPEPLEPAPSATPEAEDPLPF